MLTFTKSPPASDLFPPTLDDQIAEVRFELGMRKSAYPRLVANGKMTETTAENRMKRMREVLESLHRLKGLEK